MIGLAALCSKKAFLFLILIQLTLSFTKVANGQIPDQPHVSVREEYVYETYFDATEYNDERLAYHSLGITVENLEEQIQHNLTLVVETGEIIERITLFYPSGYIKNTTQNGRHFISAVFDGTSCELEIMLRNTEIIQDPIDLAIIPSDTDLFSADSQNRVYFGVWLNASRPISNALLAISSQTGNSKVRKFAFETNLKTGMNASWADEAMVELLEIPAGDHYLDIEMEYEENEGSLYLSLTTTEIGNFVPADFFLDAVKLLPEKRLLFRYVTYNVEFLKGIVPQIYGYRDPKYYNLDYVSSDPLVLRVDATSRELIEYMLIDAEIEGIRVEKHDVYGNPTYEIVLSINSSSRVSLGLMVYEKKWFLRQSGMKLDDIPEFIREKYTTPSASFDGFYIDSGSPLVQLWAKELIGDETNPFSISYAFFKNLTETLRYTEDLERFSFKDELASATLARKTGVCRHFARAFAALAIAANIPVRTVLGTAFGLFNETYKKNHEWNEIYCPKYGWVAVDLTWENFAELPSSHLVSTYWRYQRDSFDASYADDSQRLKLKNETKQSLHKIIDISEKQIERFVNQTRLSNDFKDKMVRSLELLSQARKQTDMGNIHDALLSVSEANLTLNALEEIAQVGSVQYFDVYLLLVAISALGALTTAVLNYLSRPLYIRTIERHSDELKEIARNWLNEIPQIPFSRQPQTMKPSPIKVPSEDLLLFHDLKAHSPNEMRIFQTWDKFKHKLDEYNQKRFSICVKALNQIKSETQIPVTAESNEEGILYPHFVRAVYLDAHDLATGNTPYYTARVKEEEPRLSGKNWELWVSGDLYAKGMKELVEKAHRYMITFLEGLDHNSYTEVIKEIIKDEKELHQLRPQLTSKIKDLVAIPIFPGKCDYIRKAVPGVYQRVKNFFFHFEKNQGS